MNTRLPLGAIAALLCVLPGSAAAFDGLRAVAAVLPITQVSADEEFYFISPKAVADWPPRTMPDVGLPEIQGVMLDADLGIRKVGIAFPDLDGLATYRTGQHLTIYLVGADIASDTVGRALMLRDGMEETERNGVTVFTEGEDGATIITGLDDDYPFAGGWRAHRVAVADGRALVAFNWADLNRLLGFAFGGEEPVDRNGGWRFADLVAAAANEAPVNADAFAAAGFPVTAFRPGGEPDPEAGTVPDFDYALQVGWTDADREGAQLVLAYGDPADAEAAAAVMADRFAADGIGDTWPAETQIVASIADLPGGAAATVISMIFPPGADDHPAAAQLQRWTTEILSGRLGFVAVAP